MNYLAHLLLAQPRGPSWIANLMGDFMTGTPLDSLPDELRRGVENHYAVDRYTDDYPCIKEMRHRFAEPYQRCSGIAMDVAFDHFLIRHWSCFCYLPLQEFLNRVYAEISCHKHLLNSKMKRPVEAMIHSNWLVRYGSLEGLEYALGRLSQRFSFTNPVGDSFQEILRLYEDLEDCFLLFFPDLIRFVHDSALEDPSDETLTIQNL